MGKKNRNKKKPLKPDPAALDESIAESSVVEGSRSVSASPSAQADVGESDDEGAEGYRKGGYHPVNIGEMYNNRYKIIQKLGWGHFSTVWLASDQKERCYVAIKFQKSAHNYTEAAFDEIDLLSEVSRHVNDPEWIQSKEELREIFANTLPMGAINEETSGVIKYINYFQHTGPNGKHVAMVFEVMGPNLLQLIRQYNFKGIPVKIVRQIVIDVLIGLDYLHRLCKIIHTDLKPENVLVSASPLLVDIEPPALTKQQKKYRRKKEKKKMQKLAAASAAVETKQQSEATTTSEKNDEKEYIKTDTLNDHLNAGSKKADDGHTRLSSPAWVKPLLLPNRSDPSLLTSHPEDRSCYCRMPYHHLLQYRINSEIKPNQEEKEEEDAAEVESVPVMADPYHDTAHFKVVDLGNACRTDRHFSDDIQTRQYRSPEVIIGSGYDTSSDVWSLACMIFELCTGDYLFDPKSTEQFSKDEDHLALCMELLGPMPVRIIEAGEHANFFFASDLDRTKSVYELRHIKQLHYWPLPEVLIQKYNFQPIDAHCLASFLIPMLDLEPNNRKTAQELLRHPWLRDEQFILDYPSPQPFLTDPSRKNIFCSSHEPLAFEEDRRGAYNDRSSNGHEWENVDKKFYKQSFADDMYPLESDEGISDSIFPDVTHDILNNSRVIRGEFKSTSVPPVLGTRFQQMREMF
eukprot:GHVL01041091.1.p1 GENE.GHVL01041091.1~~GHVL01041091.1.p1  ORF type:complete len:688 (+),score=119.73 GHVL01041091.1:54-2117(+)